MSALSALTVLAKDQTPIFTVPPVLPYTQEAPFGFKPSKTEEIADLKYVETKASEALGIKREQVQEQLAKLALSGDDGYKSYLQVKENTLTGIRSTLIRTYTDLFKVYREIGFTERESDKLATEAALETKKSIMPVFETLFPSSGKKIKKVY
jgi:hypothetical protein